MARLQAAQQAVKAATLRSSVKSACIPSHRSALMTPMNLGDIRCEYEKGALHRRDLDPDPIKQFERWLADAMAANLLEPTAMTIATADAEGSPSARVCLLKRVGADGFVFFTNYFSAKGRDIAAN